MDNDSLNPALPPDETAAGDSIHDRRPSKAAMLVAMAAVGVAILLVMLAPGGGSGDTATPVRAKSGSALTGSPNSVEEDAEADAKITGKAAPLDFVLKDMNGVDVKLAAFRGKPIVMNFWATWCGPCRAEIPSLVELQTKYSAEGTEVVILGVS